jgi:HTH-type transcriptional repressor of NAD biosynthesis genes
LERSGTDRMMLPNDYTDILLQHKIREIEAMKTSNRILFEDTDCLITLFYIGFIDGEQKENNIVLAEAIAHFNSYDLILFLEPDVPFVQDGDRSGIITANREKYSNNIKEIYQKYGFKYEIITGNYQHRFENAVELIDNLLK